MEFNGKIRGGCHHIYKALYLDQDIVPFALFSNHPHRQMQLAHRLYETEKPDSFCRGKPVKDSTTLLDLVGPESHFLFKLMPWMLTSPGWHSQLKVGQNVKKLKHLLKDSEGCKWCGRTWGQMTADFANVITTYQGQRNQLQVWCSCVVYAFVLLLHFVLLWYFRHLDSPCL